MDLVVPVRQNCVQKWEKSVRVGKEAGLSDRSWPKFYRCSTAIVCAAQNFVAFDIWPSRLKRGGLLVSMFCERFSLFDCGVSLIPGVRLVVEAQKEVVCTKTVEIVDNVVGKISTVLAGNFRNHLRNRIKSWCQSCWHQRTKILV